MDTRNAHRRTTLGLALFLAALAPALAAPAAAAHVPAVAILEISNAGLDPRVDYLSGIVQGILAFDIGSRSDLALVDRRNLDALLKEKELSLSSLGQDADSAAAAGKLVGADWLLSGEYVFLGNDVLLTLSLTEASTAKRTVFRDRGPTENLVHKLAEQIVLRLTGRQAAFVDPGRSRSLVNLRDETPGSIALFSPIIRAEVFLDEQFVGYTTGDSTVPLVLDKLSPGQHRIRVHLDRSFGVIKLPEVVFQDWEVKAEVEANKRLTLRDETRQFNYSLSRIISLGGEWPTLRDAEAEPKAALASPKLAFVKDFPFKDRSGADIDVRVESKPRLEGGEVALDITLSAGPKGKAPASAAMSLSVPSGDDGEKSIEIEAGMAKLSATLSRRTNYISLNWRVERTDIRQNMFSE